MFKADIKLEITFNLNDIEKTVIKTNARKRRVTEILEAWVSNQVGRGEDKSKPNKKDIYKITIELDLNGDVFRTRSDTGNLGLTCGLVMGTLDIIDKIKIEN